MRNRLTNTALAQAVTQGPPQRNIFGICTACGSTGMAAIRMWRRWIRLDTAVIVVTVGLPWLSTSVIVSTLPPHRFLKSCGLDGSGSIVMCRSSAGRVPKSRISRNQSLSLPTISIRAMPLSCAISSHSHVSGIMILAIAFMSLSHSRIRGCGILRDWAATRRSASCCSISRNSLGVSSVTRRPARSVAAAAPRPAYQSGRRTRSAWPRCPARSARRSPGRGTARARSGHSRRTGR